MPENITVQVRTRLIPIEYTIYETDFDMFLYQIAYEEGLYFDTIDDLHEFAKAHWM